MKKYISTILIITLVFLMNLSVYAAEDGINKTVDGSELTNERFSEDIKINPQRGNILNRGAAKITNNGDGSVNVYGAVYGSVVCDKLVLEMVLQKYVNGTWQTIKNFSDTASNKSYLVKSYNVSVTKGYYYRVKAACVAFENGVSESQAPVTDGIMIN